MAMVNRHYSIVMSGLVMLLLLLANCGETEQVGETERVLSVKAMVVKSSDRAISTSYTGSLEGERQAILYTKLAEAVDSIWVKQGDTVSSGQVLLSLDRSGPTSSYREVHSTYLNAEKNFHKMEYLFAEGAISESDYDATKTSYEVSQANLDAVTRLVEIQTPISGIVASINVLPGDFVAVGQELVTVATRDRLRIRFGVNTNDIRFFELGAEVRILSDVVDGVGRGTIAAIASSADPTTRTFEVKAIINNSERLFNPGMFVHLEYIRERLDGVVAIPRQAVLMLDGMETVFSIVNGQAQKRLVSLGAELSGEVVIESGLLPGDTLVTLGQDYLEDGVSVNITALNETAP
jgi:membrane fusion protein (multidrug efflux system)